MSPRRGSAVFYRRPDRWTCPEIVRAEGVDLYDAAGKRYLDAAGGALVVGVGHGVPESVDAVRAQMENLSTTSTAPSSPPRP